MSRGHPQEDPRRAGWFAPSMFPVVQGLDGNTEQFRKFVLGQTQPGPRRCNRFFPFGALLVLICFWIKLAAMEFSIAVSGDTPHARRRSFTPAHGFCLSEGLAQFFKSCSIHI